jgi:regulator of protease activity HflC (stomatin/prohibitin superfamily)
MADVKKRLFLRYLRGTPTTWIEHRVRGKVRYEGVGQSFWYRPLTALLSEVPVNDSELPLLFHARTSDFADVTVQATVTYRIADPALAATRLDFSIDPVSGLWRAKPLDQAATLLAELAQQPALDVLARIPLTEALIAGVAQIRAAVTTALRDPDSRAAEIGITVVSARVVAIRPEPELERALQTPTREAVQAEADRATYARRAQAVEQERAIAENELQNKIELARREQQLVEQHGANTRRKAELDTAAQLVQVRGKAEQEQVASEGAAQRARVLAAANADQERMLSIARADGVRAVGVAEGEAEAARLAAYRDLPPAVLHALALKELAGHVPSIEQLTVTPDLLTTALARFANPAANP